MNKCILLGVDANISPATQHALRTVGELLERANSSFQIVLLHVIPLPFVPSPSLGMYVGQVQPALITMEQRAQAENVLHRASLELHKQGIERGCIELVIRAGIPADEIVKSANELHANFIVIGSRGNSFRQSIRRFFTGSISHKVLQLAVCPVMIVGAPQTSRPADLVKWYEEAITHYLLEHTGDLTVFTSHEVAQMFVPPTKKTAGRKEVAAAILALEQLAGSGVLCRHDVKGEMRYVND